eukprot:CAMPEP_0176433644 /NCGR_PEP_ID=MMETSP0127-20121128/16160_1 /TAXON_ID=938130 /ORGANISM="Platyophrya macrostoma, Strain WH" /LENGTH=339 /DNA_ID=CAMNT_0017816141 /DNA_START=29 /DNA_END=1048 /DNA_ORIENTATION=-
MKTSIVILSLLALSVLANAYNPYVEPTASMPDALVKVSELHYLDLSSYFSGYNLEFSTDSDSAIIQSPIQFNGAGTMAPSLYDTDPTFVSQTYPKDVTGNIDYSGYILYLTRDNFLYFATISNHTATPTMVDGLQLTTLKGAHCYNAAHISRDFVIVDCMYMNNTSGVQTDYFFYVTLSTRNVTAQSSQQASAKTTAGSAARGVRVADFGNGNHFIFRYVGFDAFADVSNQNNSYVEVYKAFDWTKPRHFALLTKDTFNADSLALIGFEVLNGALFFLDRSGTVYQIQNYPDSFELKVLGALTEILIPYGQRTKQDRLTTIPSPKLKLQYLTRKIKKVD